ncbi:MAG: hypothetical protein PF637_05190 [Spirochaetes bacterium]|jgi:hypothetical protein|nr:hypothetical protein [Spirochaetota bacterium]
MHQHQEKISSFVSHLLSNPNVQSESALMAEQVVLNFINTNLEKLKVNFQSPQFFPGVPASQILQMIATDLRNRTVKEILPDIYSAIDSVDFTVLGNMFAGTYNSDYYNQMIKGYIKEIINNREARLTFQAMFNIFKASALERYIGSSFSRHSPLYFELVRVQKNNLRTEEYVNYLKTLLLLRGAAFLKEELPPLSTTKVNIVSFKNEPRLLSQYFSLRSKQLQRKLPGIDSSVLEMALKSNLSETYLTPEDSSARFLHIMTQRFHNYQEYRTIDRGAETPDKSWFSIMRKNAKFYGFDKRLLEDLFMIAGDNNW